MPIPEDISTVDIANVADIWKHAGDLNERIIQAEIDASNIKGHGSLYQSKIQDIQLLQIQFIMNIAEMYQSVDKPLSQEATDGMSEKVGDRWSRMVMLSDALKATGVSMKQISALEESKAATR